MLTAPGTPAGGGRVAQIVVPLDTSPLAEEALPWAALLARAQGAGLHLVTVEHDGHAPTDEIDSVLAYLNRVASAEDLDGLRVSVELRNGEVLDEVIATVGERDTAAVVMTSHGRGGLRRIFLGSVAQRLVRTLDVPVMVQRRGGAAAALDRILVTLDGTEAAEEALGPARALAAQAGAELVMLSVYADHPETHIAQYPGMDFLGAHVEEMEAAAGAYLNSRAVDGERWEALPGRPLDVIVHFARDEDCDLIVMATHGRGGLVHLALGGTSDGVMRTADRPVLFIPARGDDEPAG